MPRNVDLLNLKIGRLTVVECLGLHPNPDGRKAKMWRCECECGKETIVKTIQLTKTKPTQSCGCLRVENAYRVHELTAGKPRNRPKGAGLGRTWEKPKVANSRANKSKSKSTPIKIKTPIVIPPKPLVTIPFDVDKWLQFEWAGIVRRCTDPNSNYYYIYGGSGVTIASEWETDFDAFRNWVAANLPPIEIGTKILRIDRDGDYVPGNLKWAQVIKKP
jgi:hypothetical protein